MPGDHPKPDENRSGAVFSGSDRLDALSQHAQDALMGIGVKCALRAGRTLVWAGQVANAAFVVRSGRLRVRRYNVVGEEEVVGWLGPGAFVALASVISDAAFPFDIVADENCIVIRFERARLLELMQADATTCFALARTLGERVRQLLEIHSDRTSGSVAERVWATISRLARVHASGRGQRGVVLEITQSDLARAAGASRYRVGLELQLLANAGRVRVARGRIIVIDQVQ